MSANPAASRTLHSDNFNEHSKHIYLVTDSCSTKWRCLLCAMYKFACLLTYVVYWRRGYVPHYKSLTVSWSTPLWKNTSNRKEFQTLSMRKPATAGCVMSHQAVQCHSEV